ncbi:hypothetical protein PILCRDRAFT_818819 [Piloderma croceum F 1598]|uniref:Ribosomal protein S11 n=1 Tax=Piloderma croceum (strain F 1598) TaxID=765440 RepID=A0A0C3FW63_PILCF|nr:hypothetical protein PILCRDRAFT_818819 [Piloderma croceum F 1598]
MLASKCFPSFVAAATKRPRLSAFISSETNSTTVIRDTLQSASEYPPSAPSNSYPRLSHLNPMTNLRTFGLDIGEKRPTYHLHWKSTRHNTVATFTNDEGNVVGWISGGCCGFKHSRRGEYEAGYQCAVRIFKKIEERLLVEPFKLELIYKGFGLGRQALDSALLTTEGEKIRPLLVRLTDRTPLKIGGTRAKKARRL